MRPHRLRVTAFGAFGGTVEVCFDDLAGAGLFLLHGETGAGKTTLLDAIGFALYGRVPGERAKTRRLRSDHAVPGTSTEVELEATLGGRRMRITRKPEQQRPKRRGGGTTTEQAKVLLEEHDGSSWRAVSTGPARPTTRSKISWACPPSSSTRSCCCLRASSRGSCTPTLVTARNCCRSCSAPTGSAPWRRGSPTAAAPPPARSRNPSRPSGSWLR